MQLHMGLSNGKKMYTLILLVLGIGVGISSCRPKSIKTNAYIVHNSGSFLSDSSVDSSRYRFDYFTFRDSVFTERELTFEAITEVDFQNYKVNTRLDCQLDSGIQAGKNSFFLRTRCNEVCSNSLVFPERDQELVLSCDYDGGILGALLSPNHKQLLVFAGYDGADFLDYYDKRSLVQLYRVHKRKGVFGVQPVAFFGLTDWSIEDFCWVNNAVVAFKVFTERNGDASDSLKYSYFKANVTHD